MTEEQQPLVAEAAQEPQAEQAAEKAAKVRKKRTVKRKARKPRLQKFDALLLQLLKEGKSDAEEIRALFNVDAGEFRKRLETLLRRKLIVANAEFSELHLSIQGVNEYKPEWKKQADKWLGRKETEKENTEGEKPAGEKAALEAQDTKQEKLEVEVEKKSVEADEVSAVERLDLEEVIRKYGPNESQRHWKQRPSPFIERHVNNKPQEKDKTAASSDVAEIPVKVVRQGSSGKAEETAEKCELCKSGFVVSVKQEENNPKYGHCFCGAAYHKDCYEAVLEGDKKCVRCGRKLALTLDLKAEEAVSGITDISA